MNYINPVILALLVSLSLSAQNQSDTTKKKAKEKAKSGFNFGMLPVLAYDTDIGLKYGGLVNLYHYGDGTVYPDYKHSIYFEWSRTTKGSGINQLLYDSEYLIPNIRISAEASYFTEQTLDFYGFNGYKSLYHSGFEDDSEGNADYISRVYYRQDRKLLKLRADFQGNFPLKNTNWVAGLVHNNIELDTVDIEKLNKNKEEEDLLPPVEGGLFGEYIRWGLIPDDQKNGGTSNFIKLGIRYDTRDNEPNPMKGIWSEVLLIWAPSFLGNKDYAFSKLAITHRQYFTLIDPTLSLACRLGYQMKLGGEIPFYMLPFIFNAGRSLTRDGLGGAKTLRGVQRNRVVGNDMAYANFELRWKFLRAIVLNQNIYFALVAFTDMGMVTKEYEVNISNVPAGFMHYFPDTKESLHASYGAGLYFALNQNFVVAASYGVAAKKEDGESGFYLNLNFLY